MTPRCEYCRMELDPNAPSTLRRIVGWERRAVGGTRRGGSDVVLREPLGEKFACSPCVDRQKHGVSPSQASLM